MSSLPAQEAAGSAARAGGVQITGLMFGAFSTRTDSAARAALGGERPLTFSIDRIYVTFKAPAGDNGAFRLTTDVYQNANAATNAYYQGWAIRLKYAWFQYTMLRGAAGEGSSLVARVGSIHNIVIDQVEGPWPRYVAAIAVERVPYFSSADVGVGGLLTLGHHLGEVYATLTNGTGYSAPDRDRFKDPAIRATLTPLANTTGYFSALSIMPWYYRGYVGSRFAAGGAGQAGDGDNGAVTGAMPRDRYGLFVGVRDRRLTVGADLAWQRDATEAGANTAASPRTVVDSIGRMLAGYAVVRPYEWMHPDRRSPVAVYARYDHQTPNVDPDSPDYGGRTPAYDFTVVGGSYDVNQRFTLAVDWQVDRAVGFPPVTASSVRPRPDMSVLSLRWNATF